MNKIKIPLIEYEGQKWHRVHQSEMWIDGPYLHGIVDGIIKVEDIYIDYLERWIIPIDEVRLSIGMPPERDMYQLSLTFNPDVTPIDFYDKQEALDFMMKVHEFIQPALL